MISNKYFYRRWVVIGRGLLFVLAMVSTEIGYAQSTGNSLSGLPKSTKPGEVSSGPRRKELDFEEKIIEGLTNKDYTSLLQSGAQDYDTRQKLYRKRADFQEETNYMLRELEYLK